MFNIKAPRRNNLFTKLVAGAPTRKTRLHDELGNLVPVSRFLRNGPRAAATAINRLSLGIRPARPWISYDAQRVLDCFLTNKSRVLEFGSGTSTGWYADRARSVLSIEDDLPWFQSVSSKLSSRSNVDYRFALTPEEYTRITGNFDLVMIDGSYRAECVEAAISHVAPGAIIYLDNSDKGVGGLPGDVPRARQVLQRFAQERRAEITFFTDFAPTQLFVQQGMMVALAC